jgi:hypothetical protein
MMARSVCGYLLCGAGMGLLGCAWSGLIHWGWGIPAIVLFLIGWRVLRSRRHDDSYGLVDDLSDSAIDGIFDVNLDLLDS